jgi:hypothetical protein
MINTNFAVLPAILTRWITRRNRRPYVELVDIIFAWRNPANNIGSIYAQGLLAEQGPISFTIGAHESVRAAMLKRIAWHGIYFAKGRYTWRCTAIVFCFTISVEWCTKPNFEKVDPWRLGQN